MAITISALIFTMLFAVCIVKLLFMTKNRIHSWTAFREMPGPTEAPLPLIGHSLLFRGDVVQSYKSIIRVATGIAKRGHEAGRVWLAGTPVILVVGASAAEVLLRSSQHTTKAFFYDFLHPWLGTGLLTSSGEKWKLRRRLLTPTFHFQILQDFLEVMNEHSNAFVKKLESHAETNEAFEICKPITLNALDIICETAMGKSVQALDNEDSEYVKAINRSSQLIQIRQRSPWLWWDFVYYLTKDGQEFTKHVNILHTFTQSIILDRMRRNKAATPSPTKKRLAFLDMLLSVSDDGKVLSFQDIQEEVDTFMFEGHDTTAAAMSWALQLIGANPDVQRKIQAEVDQVFGNDTSRPLSMDDLKKLEYLEMVIKESLRLFPSVPSFARITSSDCIIDGHHIPKGTDVIVLSQGVNGNSKYWTDPCKFDPERFSAKRSVGRHPYCYIPFSAGPRNCIGQKFALMEEKVIIGRFLSRYSIESCERTEDLPIAADIILRPRDGVNVKITRR